MYAYLKGKLAYKTTDFTVIDVNGVGYKVFTPDISNYNKDDTIQLYTHLNVRETEMNLYGFTSQDELKLFELIITVSGIGPKVGLNILKHISTKDFIVAVMYDDEKALTKLPGIGKKTAKRVILELKEKLNKLEIKSDIAIDVDTSVSTSGLALDEVVEALIALGYDIPVAKKVAKQQYINNPNFTVEQLLKQCLRSLAMM